MVASLLSDRDLVAAHLAGDPTAFAAIVARHRPKVWAVCVSIAYNRSDAEEVTNETFAKAARYLARFQWRCELSSWLYRIAKGLSCSRRTHEKRRGIEKQRPLDLAKVDALMSDTPCGRGSLLQTEVRDSVEAAMRLIDPAQRRVLYLFGVKHLSYIDIAAQIGVPQGTVKSQLARGRTKLIALLRRRNPELAACFTPRHAAL